MMGTTVITEDHDRGDEDRRVEDLAVRRREYMCTHGISVLSSIPPEVLAELGFLVLTREEIEDALAAGRRDREAAERACGESAMNEQEPRSPRRDDDDVEGPPARDASDPDDRSGAAELPSTAEASSRWRASPPTADEIRGGRIHWWVQPPGGAPWPVELFTRGDAVVEAKSGLPIERRQMEDARWTPCVPPTQISGFVPTTADRVTLGRIHDAAPPLHVGDLARRLVKRILSVACPVQSSECAIRGMCTNKCGALDRCEADRH